ncbi:MAG TPA: heavy metal translocating P-type ATPase [Blastocatellia bacterium]|nr:heavy metal translocating P-type ATPase [Blastocatellia bacterium]
MAEHESDQVMGVPCGSEREPAHDAERDSPLRQDRAAYIGVRPAETGEPACQVDLGAVIPGETDEFGRFEKLEQLVEARVGITDVHVRRDSGEAEICIHYDDEQLVLAQVVALVRSAGADVSKRYLEHTWSLHGMDSAQCGYVIEHVLARLPGVLTANVAYGAGRLVVEYDREAVSPRQIESRTRAIGYRVEEPERGPAHLRRADRAGLAPELELPLVIAAGLSVGMGLIGRTWLGAPPVVPTAFFILGMVSGGFLPLRGALLSLRQGIADIEMLMVLAAVGAGALGAWFEGAFLLFLFSLGHLLEHRAMDRARRAITALGGLCPQTARVKRIDTIVELPVNEVRCGDLLLVRPGDRVPLDGRIDRGHSSLDQATITGDPVPVAKGPGDAVFAGTVNTEGPLEVEVTKLSSESVLSRVIDMVSEAEAQKGPAQRFAQRLERVFVPIILCVAPLLTASLFFSGLGFRAALLRGLSLLVAASPCALAIATPVAVLSAVARAARSGVLIKGGAQLEALGKVASIAFDKTGTLTVGRPRLITVSVAPGVSEPELLAAAAAAESNSSHPIAQAILDGARSRGISHVAAESVEVLPGKGLRSCVNGETVNVGNLTLFQGEAVPGNIAATMRKLEAAGQTTVIVKSGRRFLGILGVADTIRHEARETLSALRRAGIKKNLMLSGDNLAVAKAIGRQVGIDDARAPLRSESKVAVLRGLAKEGGVAMVANGMRDAPALAAASVGIAMGGAGSEVALETADLVLMGDGLHHLPFAVTLARKAGEVINQNLLIAVGVSTLLVIASFCGWAQIGQAVIVHEGSTLLVVLNGLRLLGYRD